MAEGWTAEQISKASGLSIDEILMLGQEPYLLLKAHPTSKRYRASQVSWARFLAELKNDKKLTWLEIRVWVEKRQKRD